MPILRQQLYFHDQDRANNHDFERLEGVEEERCGLCWDRWPKSMIRDNNGVRRCPDCYEERDIYRINDIRQYDNNRIATRQTRPQVSIASLAPTPVPFIRSMTDVNSVKVSSLAPLALVRSGPAVALTLTGGNFASGNTFAYSSGITDNSAPALTGTSSWALSLVASGSMAAGLWHMTFNGHIYRNIFFVR